MLKRQLKLYPGPSDSRDYKITLAESTVNTAKPKSATKIDLSVNCTSVKDQGSLGSCTAFASIGAMEFLQKKFGKNTVNDIFSERFTYYATRVNILGWMPEDSGAYVRDAIKSLVKFGSCKEATFPYNDDCTTAPPQSAYNEATKFQALSYARFDDCVNPGTNKNNALAAVKAGLEAGLPIVAGFVCYSNIWNAVKGVIPLPNNQVIGGHAILIVGYDDSNQLFKFKNSWSTSWGDAGYGYLPYAYFTTGNMFDLWTIYKAEDNDTKSVGLDIIDPSKIKQQFVEDIQDVLEVVKNKLPTIMNNKASVNAFFIDLIRQYSSKPKIANVVNTLKNQLTSLV